MRRVTVRVSEDADWQFQAERADGTLLFAIECKSDAATTPTSTAASAPEPELPPRAADLPYHLGDHGYMLGKPSEERTNSLYDLRDVVELALPQPTGARVVELAAGNGETTVAYSAAWRMVDHWLIDPFLAYTKEEAEQKSLPLLLDRNHEKYFSTARITTRTAVDLGNSLDKQDVSLLIIAAEITRKHQSELLSAWLPHLLPTGRVVLRLPDDGTPLSINGMEIHQAGEWLLYSPPSEGEASDG